MDANEEQLIKKVEKAARKGAMKGSGLSGIVTNAVAIIAIVIIALVVSAKMNRAMDQLTSFEDPAESHDMVLENDGFLGYTAADFAEAILGKDSQLKKLEVYNVEVSDVVTITDTGLMNWSVFTKCQLITYNGYATYTVDLGEIGKNDISLDEENKIVSLKIPHACLEPINIPTDEIVFGDTTKGLLAFGDIQITPEQSSEIQKEAEEKMNQKLTEQDAISKADRFAILSVWEIYQPLVKSVSPDYALEVSFQ